MYFPGGTGSNEVLTLAEAAERFGIVDRARPERRALALLRRMERDTGRHLLVETGEGKSRRYLVLGRELDAALDGEEKVPITSIAEKVAAAVQRIEDRLTAMSVRLDAVTTRVDRLERRTVS